MLLDRISKAALHGIHIIPPTPEVAGDTGGKEPISLKKLQKLDANWSSKKEILGLLVDGKAKNVRIPNTKAENIVADIQRILKKKRVPLKWYRGIIGKLRHMAIILPGTRKAYCCRSTRRLKGNPQS